MSRCLAFSNVKRITNSLLRSRKIVTSTAKNYRLFCIIGFPHTLWRLHYQNNHPFLLHEVRHNLSYCTSSFRKFCANLNHAPVARKIISQLCLHARPTVLPITRISCMVSLALSRSNLVSPTVIAFIIGELALARKTQAEAENLITSNCMYTQERDWLILMTTLLLSLIEGSFLLLRAIYLTVLFLPCIAMAPFADNCNTLRRTWLHLVRVTLEKAGPAFIKWGQWAATRPDLFPQDLCAELAILHANEPAHCFEFTKITVEKAFGRKLSEVFVNFEEVPVASGSIAQVHRATLKYRYPGQENKPIVVAVKVRHPRVAEAIRRDFVLINFFAKISCFIPTFKWSRLDESVQQFAVFMMSQVDLAREAANLSHFLYNFQKWKDVSFPRPLYPLVHPEVLVETYEKGERIMSHIDGFGGNKSAKRVLAHVGTQVLLKMLLVDNFIHADMHPGNILVRLTDDKPMYLSGSKPQLVLLDVGMTVELSKRDQSNMLEFFRAVALLDGKEAAKGILNLSTQQNCPDPKAFTEEVEKCYIYWRSPDHTPVHPADCMRQILDLVRCHKVNIDGNVCIVMVTTLVLQGWQRKLDPNYDIMQTLKSMFFKADWAESLCYNFEGLMAP